MSGRRTKMPAVALTISLMVHAIALYAASTAMEAAADRQRARADQERRENLPMTLPPEKPVEVELGIAAPTPPTPTWLGFEDPLPQIAEANIMDQAAFTKEPSVAAPESMLNPPPQPPQPENVQAAAAQLQSEPPIEQLAAKTETEKKSKAEPQAFAKDPFTKNPDLLALNTPKRDSLMDPAQTLIEQIQKMLAAQQPPAPEKAASQQPPATSQAEQKQQKNPSTPPSNPSNSAPSKADPGLPSDKESTPASVIDIPPDQWQLGKPLARHGLELKPKRPEFALLTLLTASPGNPLCEISFGRDGVPVAAKLLRSSGDKRVDDAILASLYRWRAEGDELAKIPDGKTIDVRVNIILNRRDAD